MVGVVCDNQNNDIWILYVNVGRMYFSFAFLIASSMSLSGWKQDVRNDLSSFSLCCLLSVLDTILQILCARLKGTLTLVWWRRQLRKSL